MKQKDKDKIIARYEKRLEEFGPVQKALGWLKGRQRFRFYYLEEVNGFGKTDSVLDLGCGYGDLYDYLNKNNWKGKYCGIDLVPGLISEAKKRYPKADLRLLDLQEEPFSEKFDWVFSSGALTSKTEDVDSYAHFKNMLTHMFSLCNKGVAVNFCSPLVEFESDVNFHPDFGKLLEMITSLSKRFTLRHDYMPFEFTVYIYKEDAVIKELNIFESAKDIYDRFKVID